MSPLMARGIVRFSLFRVRRNRREDTEGTKFRFAKYILQIDRPNGRILALNPTVLSSIVEYVMENNCVILSRIRGSR